MLGPALSHLLATLDQRSANLTPFETALLAELKAAKAVGPALSDVLELRRDRRIGHLTAATPGEAGAAAKFDRLGAEWDLKVQVDLGHGGWGADDRLQTACKKVDCPNKVQR